MEEFTVSSIIVKELSKLMLDWSALSRLSLVLGRSEDFRSIAVLFLLTVVVLVVFPELGWLLLLWGGVADSDSRIELVGMLVSGNLSWFVSTILVKPLVGSVLDNSSFIGANDIFGNVPPE